MISRMRVLTGFDQGVGEAMLQGRDQGVNVGGDPVGDRHEGCQPGVERPPEPVLEQCQRLLDGELKDEPQVLLEQVGAIEGLIHPLHPGQFALLSGAEPLGVLPEGPADAFQEPTRPHRPPRRAVFQTSRHSGSGSRTRCCGSPPPRRLTAFRIRV